jgi:DNA-binding winged helix-turn-helix (wHTH) protein
MYGDQDEASLRAKLGDRSLIRTVRGVGYKLTSDVRIERW